MSQNRYTIHDTGRISPVGDPIKEQGFVSHLLRTLIAVVFIAAMLYFSGIYQFSRFQETGPDVSAGTYSSLVQKQVRSIPANIYLLSSRESETAQSVASSSEVIVQKAADILTQASLSLEVNKVERITASSSPSGPELVSSNEKLRELLPELSENELSIVLTRGLAGINGVAFGGTSVVAVAEYTTSFDFRVLAHEVGHVLGEEHVGNRANLMNSGGTGTELTLEQAKRMYSRAERFVSQ